MLPSARLSVSLCAGFGLAHVAGPFLFSGVSKVVCESTLPVFVTGFSQANPLQPNPCGGEPPEEGGWFEKSDDRRWHEFSLRPLYMER
jgi:hypothetical protein